MKNRFNQLNFKIRKHKINNKNEYSNIELQSGIDDHII